MTWREKKVDKILFVLLIMVFLFRGTIIQAADFNGSVSSSEVNQGDTVNLTVTFSSGTSIGAYAMRLTYDANILEYVSGADGGGGGTLQFYNDYVNSTSKSYQLVFRAKNAGSTSLSLEAISTPCDTEANDMQVRTTGGTVKVNAPKSYSSNNRLAALNIALVYEDGHTESAAISPGFTADGTEYHLQISENVTRLSVDASGEDVKSVVQVSGTRMDPGSNTTVITVTAEDGSVRKYVIYTDKTQKEPESVEETTQPEMVEETTEPESTEETTQQEETTGEEPQGFFAEVDGVQYEILSIPEELELPEGYEVIQTEFGGQTVQVLQGLSTNLQLFYLKNPQTQECALYIYQKETQKFLKFLTIEVRAHVYVILPLPEDVTYPFGGSIGKEFKRTELKKDETTIEALSYGNESIFFVYAMNWLGESGFYYYDTKEETFLRYESSSLENVTIQQETTAAANVSVDKSDYERKLKIKNYMILGLSGLAALLLVTLIIISVLIKKHDNVPEEEEEEEQEFDVYQQQEEPENEEEEEEKPMEEEALNQALDDLLKKK